MHIPQVEKNTPSQREYTPLKVKWSVMPIPQKEKQPISKIFNTSENTIVQTFAQNVIIITTSEEKKPTAVKINPIFRAWPMGCWQEWSLLLGSTLVLRIDTNKSKWVRFGGEEHTLLSAFSPVLIYTILGTMPHVSMGTFAVVSEPVCLCSKLSIWSSYHNVSYSLAKLICLSLRWAYWCPSLSSDLVGTQKT